MLVFENFEYKEVPEDYCCCCSVCGAYKPLTDYNNDGSKFRTRTNCKECYELPYEEMKLRGDAYKELQKSPQYKTAYRKFKYYSMAKNNSITKDEYIKNLKASIKRLQKELPDDCLISEYSYDDYNGTSLYIPSGISTPRVNHRAEFGYDIPEEVDGKPLYLIGNRD